MINPTQLRRTASVTNAGFGTVDPSSLLSTDLWSRSGGNSPPSMTAPSPPDHFITSGAVGPRGKRVFADQQHQKRMFTDTHQQLQSHSQRGLDPETPLRKGRGQSVTTLSYPGIVTPQSVGRSYSVSSLPYTPGHGQHHPLMSPLDTPLATPGEPGEPGADAFFDLGAEPRLTWNFPFDMPPNAKFGDAPLGPELVADIDGSGMVPDNSLLMAADFYPKSAHGGRADSVLSSLDGTFDGYDQLSRSVSVSSMKSPPTSTRPSRRASISRHPAYGFDSIELGISAGTAASHSTLDGPGLAPAPSGVNPFYNPPSFLRRSRSEASNHGELGPPQWLAPRDSTDAGVGVFDLLGPRQPYPDVAGPDENDEDRSLHGAFVAPHFDAPPALHRRGKAALHRGADQAMFCDQGLSRDPTLQRGVDQVVPADHRLPRRGSTTTTIGSGASVGSLTHTDSTMSTTSLEPVADEKPYTCETCEKSFRRMEHLRRHMKTHTMERPYPCTVAGCHRKFSRTDNLKAHILTHAKKTGRNIYVEGLAERQDIKPIKRRKSRKSSGEIIV